MPTKLIVWNIERFTIDKINKTSATKENVKKKKPARTALQNIASSVWKLAYIRDTLSRADLFAIIEVQSAKGILGTLISGKGATGALFLLDWLRLNYNPNWRLVPPPKIVGLNEAGEKSNYTETIAVFYRSDKLNFTGPYIWPAAQNATVAVPNTGAASGPYPAPWANVLPPNNYYAAQFQFFDANGREIFFNNANMRRPLLTTFTEVGGAARTIQLVCAHTSPNKDVTTAIARMAAIREIQPAGQRVVVLAGDFNYDIFKPKTVDPYSNLSSFYNFQQNFRTNTSGNGRTMYQFVPEATPAAYTRPLGLDNIFTRYDGGLQPPPNPNPQIIDRVAGSVDYPSSMILSLARLAELYPNMTDRTENFRELMEFGHIGPGGGASDHLPLVIDL